MITIDKLLSFLDGVVVIDRDGFKSDELVLEWLGDTNIEKGCFVEAMKVLVKLKNVLSRFGNDRKYLKNKIIEDMEEKIEILKESKDVSR